MLAVQSKTSLHRRILSVEDVAFSVLGGFILSGQLKRERKRRRKDALREDREREKRKERNHERLKEDKCQQNKVKVQIG